MALPDYNLGTAHGKVVIDYDDRGSGKAKQGIDDLEGSFKKFASGAKGASGSGSEFESSLGSLSSTAASTRTKLAQLAAATLAYRAANMATIPSIQDITAKIAALGKAAKKPAGVLGGAGFALMGRSLGILSNTVSVAVPSMLGSLLSLRAVMRGVPQEMKSWPKMIQHIVAISTVIGGLKKASEWMHKGPKGGVAGLVGMLVGDVSLAEKALGGLSRKIKKDFPEAHSLLAESFRDSSDAIKSLTRAADNSISVIAQSAMGIVFAGRTVKAAKSVYHGLAWGLERFTWAMGAAGLGSLAFLKIMGTATTLVRGAGNAVSQLSKVAYLLPGAIFAVGASMATAMVGFKGFGDALGAIGKDQKDFDEATKNLAGSAKDLAVEIRDVRKEWGEFQKGIQQKIFGGLADRFSDLSGKYLPALTEGMGVSADGMNHLIHRFADFAAQGRTVDMVNLGFKDTGRILENTGNALQPFLEGIREMASVGVAAIADYSAAWEGLGTKFSAWAMMTAETGQMRAWMDESIKGFGDLWRLTSNLGSAVANAFRPFFKGDVDNALERSANATERWVSYLGADGKGGRAIQGFADHLGRMAEPWEEYLPKIMEKFSSLMESLVPVMERFSAIAAKEANTILAILVPALKAALGVIDQLGPAIGALIVVLSALRTLNWIRKALMWLFSPLTNAIASMAAFRQAIKSVGPAAKEMRTGVNGITPGVRNLVKGMNEMGKATPAVTGAAAALNKVRGAYETMYLKSSYGADSIRKSFDSMGERAQAFGQRAAFNMQNAAASVGLMGRAFDKNVEKTRSGLDRLADSSTRMTSSIAAASRGIVGSNDGISSIASSAARVEEANERVADSAARASEATARSGGVIAGAMGGMRGAASGLLDVMGGPWGAVFLAAAAVGMGFVEMNQKAAQSNRDLATATQEAASAQRQLQMAAALSGGEKNEDTLAASQRMVQAEFDKTAASADKAKGMLQGFAKFGNNVLGMSYESMAKKASEATNAIDKNGWEGQMAAKRQQALGDALKATGMTMDEAKTAFASGGPALDALKTALLSTGGAGQDVIANMSGVGASIQSAFDRVAEMGPRAAAFGAAMGIIGDAASSAEDRLNGLRVALQSLGLMEDSNFDAAQATAESIRDLADVTPGAARGVDALGKAFFDAQGNLNPFNEAAAGTQDKLASLRENMLKMDPKEAFAAFQEAVPQLEALRQNLGATDTEWAQVLTTMGLTPESINTQIAIQGMDETQRQLWSVAQQIELQDGKTADVTVTVTDQAAIASLEAMGWKVDAFDEKTGEATLTAKNASALETLNWTSGQIEAFAMKIGEATLDANGQPVADSVGQADSLIAAVNYMIGIGTLDVNDSAVASKVYAAQALIDGLRGRTIYIDVVSRNMGPLPGGAGTLDAAAGGAATGGQFTGSGFNLKGYKRGGRHGGYRLPSSGPGTEITDGFLALNHLGAPVARLDQDEWVINGKSSKKWNRLLAAVNRDDPRLKSLPAFAEGGNMKGQAAQIGKSVHTVSTQIGLAFNQGEVERISAFLAQVSSDEFANKFGKGAIDGLTLGSRDYFVEQSKQYADALGIVFGKAAQEANDRLKEEISHIQDKNLKEQREKTLKSTEELQAIADAEMMAWVNNNQFEAMGYTMAKSFADGVAGGQNLVSAGVNALGTAASMALSAAGAPAIVAALAVTAIQGLVDAFSDPALWDDGIGAGIYKIIDKMLGGLVTVILDVISNLFKMIGVNLSKVPIIGFLFDIKDAANGASKEVDKLLTDLEALNKLEYKNLGKTGATTIDAAIEAQLGNRALVSQVAPAGASGASGPSIGTLNVHAPDDKASSIIEAATFQMKRY